MDALDPLNLANGEILKLFITLWIKLSVMWRFRKFTLRELFLSIKNLGTRRFLGLKNRWSPHVPHPVLRVFCLIGLNIRQILPLYAAFLQRHTPFKVGGGVQWPLNLHHHRQGHQRTVQAPTFAVIFFIITLADAPPALQHPRQQLQCKKCYQITARKLLFETKTETLRCRFRFYRLSKKTKYKTRSRRKKRVCCQS